MYFSDVMCNALLYYLFDGICYSLESTLSLHVVSGRKPHGRKQRRAGARKQIIPAVTLAASHPQGWGRGGHSVFSSEPKLLGLVILWQAK